MGCHPWPLLQLSPGWHCQGSVRRSPSYRMTWNLKPEAPLCAVASRVLHWIARLPWGLRAPHGRSTSRAFNVPGIQGPAVAKREVGAIRLCCLGGFQGDCRLLGPNCPLSSLAPWCEMLKALGKSFRASLPTQSTMQFLSKPPVIVKRRPRFVCTYWRRDIYYGPDS